MHRPFVEELEARAQPALLSISLSVPLLATFEARAAVPAPDAERPILPVQASEVARVAVATHARVVEPTPTPAPTPRTTQPPASTPTQPPTQPPASVPAEPAAQNPAASAAVVVFPRDAVAALTVSSTASDAAAVQTALAPNFLPPEATADNEALAVSVVVLETSGEVAAAPLANAAAPAPIPFLGDLSAATARPFAGDSLRVVALDPPAVAPTTVAAAPPVEQAAVPAFVLALPPLPAPVAKSYDVAAPAAAVSAEEAVSPWVWATVVAGAVAAASWVLNRSARKPAPAPVPNPHAWRTYLLGLDFDRP